MKRDFLKELELTDEQINAIMKEHGKTVNDVKGQADKADSLESQIEDYQQQIKDRDEQLKELQESAKGNEDLQKQIQDLQSKNEEVAKEWEQKLAQQRKESKLELALKDAKARNPRAVKALLDSDKISLDGDNLIGLEEQLNSLKESDSYLFGENEPQGLKGRQPHNSDPNKGQQVNKKFGEMTSEERLQLKQEDPNRYQNMRQEYLNKN